MDEIITLDSKEYLICAEIDVDNIHYIYASEIEGDGYTLLEEKIINGEKYVSSVTDKEIIGKVMALIIKNKSIKLD